MTHCVWLLAINCILEAVINYSKIFFKGHDSIQCLIESLLVLLEVHLCNFHISVHYMVYQIYCLDPHEPCAFIAEFYNEIVFNDFNYLMLEGLVNDCNISKIWRASTYVSLACS